MRSASSFVCTAGEPGVDAGEYDAGSLVFRMRGRSRFTDPSGRRFGRQRPRRSAGQRILRMISPPRRIASSLAGSIFQARSGSDFFRPIMTFSIPTTGHTFR